MAELMANVEAITLFVEDLPRSTEFYLNVFEGAKVIYEDEESVLFRFTDSTLVNLLQTSSAPELVEPMAVGKPGHGPRLLLTIHVPDVDTLVAQLAERGVPLLNGPIDRRWGRRTATFVDPSGHVWEIAQTLVSGPAELT